MSVVRPRITVSRSVLTAAGLLLAFTAFTAVAAGDPARDGVTLLNGYAEYKMANYAKAMEIWQPLADQGNPSALLNIANLYDQGQGVPRDLEKAFEFTRRAAETGFPVAQLNLGLMYENGKGTARDLKAAAEWFERAGVQGQVDAQFNLGVIYATGFGGTVERTPETYQKARQWLEKAAAQGHPTAKSVLGSLP